MSEAWQSVRVDACSDRDGVMTALFAAGCQGIHEDRDSVVTHFPPATDMRPVLAAVAAADPSAVVTVAEAPPVSWELWRADVGAHRVGELVVTPPWLADAHDPERTVVIDPAMAFGTGEHPTTRGVLRLMHGVMRTGDTVADLGAGSAVLSIAAARLGAARVVAIELDPDAAASAGENIARNAVGDVVHFLTGDAAVLLPLVAPARVILANIVSSVLTELLPVIANALVPGEGEAILSGMLLEERQEMTDLLRGSGWCLTAEDAEGEWWSVAVRWWGSEEGRG